MSDKRPSKDEQPSKDKLDELYALVNNETPPAELDLKILAEARARVPAQRSASIYTWQRIMSVAAVMVFSVYIFFDVRDLKQSQMTDDMAVPHLSFPTKKSAERTFSGSDLSPERSSESRPESRPELKEEMALEMEMQADGVEAFSAMPELASPPVAKDQKEEAKRLSRAKEKQKAVMEDDSASSPETMLLQIRARLDAGEVEQAQALLEKFKAKYPGLDIPEDILAIFELE